MDAATQPVLEVPFEVRAYDVGRNGNLTPRRLCDYLQESAGRHAEALGFSLDRLARDDLGWVMHRLRVRVHRNPAVSERVTVTTWPSARTAVEAHRDFCVRDATGGLLAEATTRWVVMRLSSRRVSRLPAWMRGMPLPDRPRVLGGRFEELDPPPSLRSTTTFGVRLDDLDPLGHTNNAVYVAWLAESVPLETLEDCELEEVDVAFKAETRLREPIRCEAGPVDAERWAHRLLRGDDEVARAVTTWRPRT